MPTPKSKTATTAITAVLMFTALLASLLAQMITAANHSRLTERGADPLASDV
jgi:hypothetical protein